MVAGFMHGNSDCSHLFFGTTFLLSRSSHKKGEEIMRSCMVCHRGENLVKSPVFSVIFLNGPERRRRVSVDMFKYGKRECIGHPLSRTSQLLEKEVAEECLGK